MLVSRLAEGPVNSMKRNTIMNSKRTTAGLATAALLLGLSTQAAAQPLYGYADVISVTPIVRYVTVTTPVQECWDDVQYYTVNQRPPGVGAKTLAGAIIGGVIGHQFGSGRGNDAATVAGALIGAGVGNHRAYATSGGAYGPVQEARTVRRCETKYREYQEERVDGYDVVYRYHGQKYATRMPHDPGRKLRVRVDIRPAA